LNSRVSLAQTGGIASSGGADRMGSNSPNGAGAAAPSNVAAESNQQALPKTVRGYHLVTGPIVDSTGVVRYAYARSEDRIDVSLTPYAPNRPLGRLDDTVSLVENDYAVMYDTLTDLAQNNDATLRVYFDREDDVHVNGHTYRGWVTRWTWVARDGHRIGCDQSFLTHGSLREGWSCYQQTYATPQGLLRVNAQLNPGESVGGGDLPVFGNELLAEMTKK
jgi:hypothetical protein